MCALARHLTKNESAAVLAGVVFAFAPYRFGHIMHLEMQWAVWSPWAFWALQKTLESGRVKYGVLTGVFAALQLMSSVYYGLFLGVLLGVVGGLQWLFVPRERRKTSLRALAVGALVVMACAAIYSRPYRAASARVGARSPSEVLDWSAGLSSYRAVSETNRVYRAASPGDSTNSACFRDSFHRSWRVAGLVLVRPRRTAIIYAVGLALAVDMSLGLNGLIYPWLYKYGGGFQRLASTGAGVDLLPVVSRRPGRARRRGGSGTAPPTRSVPSPRRRSLASCSSSTGSHRSGLIGYPTQASALYQFLRQRPEGVIAHFPMPKPYRFPGQDPQYLYSSTFQWKPIVNGYSGYYPPSYLRRLTAVQSFPDARSVAHLMGEGVRYLVIHEAFYKTSSEPAEVILALQKLNLVPIARMNDGYGMAVVYELH